MNLGKRDIFDDLGRSLTGSLKRLKETVILSSLHSSYSNFLLAIQDSRLHCFFRYHLPTLLSGLICTILPHMNTMRVPKPRWTEVSFNLRNMVPVTMTRFTPIFNSITKLSCGGVQSPAGLTARWQPHRIVIRWRGKLKGSGREDRHTAPRRDRLMTLYELFAEKFR